MKYKHEHNGYTFFMNGYGYINIPKNASCFLKTLFPNSQIIDYRKHDQQIKQYIVALRDPIDRWISGMSQVRIGNIDPGSNDITTANKVYSVNYLFQKIVWDEHTLPQVDFIQGLDHSKVIWFKVDDTLKDLALKWAKETMKVEPYDFTNDPDNTYNISKGLQLEIKEMLLNEINLNDSYKQRLEDYYKDDYELFNSVKFYKG
jgi:hypothetical protein